MSLTTESFEGIITQMDNTKSIEELMIRHREYHDFLREKFLSRKVLSKQELDKMKEFITGEKFLILTLKFEEHYGRMVMFSKIGKRIVMNLKKHLFYFYKMNILNYHLVKGTKNLI